MQFGFQSSFLQLKQEARFTFCLKGYVKGYISEHSQ